MKHCRFNTLYSCIIVSKKLGVFWQKLHGSIVMEQRYNLSVDPVLLPVRSRIMLVFMQWVWTYICWLSATIPACSKKCTGGIIELVALETTHLSRSLLLLSSSCEKTVKVRFTLEASEDGQIQVPVVQEHRVRSRATCTRWKICRCAFWKSQWQI